MRVNYYEALQCSTAAVCTIFLLVRWSTATFQILLEAVQFGTTT